MKTLRNSLFLLVLASLALSALYLGGCAKKLDGDTYANEKPTVWFVNVPPEGAQSSVNPIVNWMGQDRDGQIDFYRYTVIREDEVGAALGMPADWNPTADPLSETEVQGFVDNHLGNRADSLWTVLLVRADSTDPHSSNIIPMSAEMSDPVRTFVPQFVFVQAVDEEGLGSDIAFRRFLRNDNPPSTRIVAFIAGVPFINSVLPSGPATGIRMRWQGSDAVDYPTDPPPFEFEWKLFGPYTDEEYDILIDSFLVPVFVTNDARVFKFGVPPTYDTTIDSSVVPWDTLIDTVRTALIICDTSFAGGALEVECDTILIDTLDGSNVYGNMDTLLRVYDEDFATGTFPGSDKEFYTLADSSHDDFGNVWITDTRDSIYNAYWNHPDTVTQVNKFIFVVRSRDDAHVPDLTPSWRGFTVINPEHERDILVMNWSSSAHENRAVPDSIKAYWDQALSNWVSETVGHSEVIFDPEEDFKSVEAYTQDNNMLKLILKYKVAIMVQDAQVSGGWSNQGEPVQNTMVALQTGVNVWVAMRVPLANGSFGAGAPRATVLASPDYQYFFGVEQTTFPGWGSYLIDFFDGYGFGLPRTEHFIGTLSLDENQWPELSVDTALLRTQYVWEGHIPDDENPGGFPFYPYVGEVGALPQVGWCVRTFDTEAMYLFKSKYGNEHAIFTELSYHGRPVGIRLNRGLFRTVHFMFTPLALSGTTGQEMVNGVMNWLYDGRLDLSPAGRNSTNQAVASELSNRYWECYWNAGGDKETFYELLKNAY